MASTVVRAIRVERPGTTGPADIGRYVAFAAFRDLDEQAETDLAVEAFTWLRGLVESEAESRADAGEGAGLLALMLLPAARRPARTGPDGDLVPMDEQDRTRWDRRLIAEGLATLDAGMARGAIGEYQLQAMIAALHDRAPRAEDTDWPQIAALYGLLERLTGSPIVTLNRAVAVAMQDGPEAGLRMLEPLDERLPGHHRLDAVRAHLHERAGDLPTAIRHYRAAAAATSSLPEQRYLTLKAARLHAQAQGSGASTRE